LDAYAFLESSVRITNRKRGESPRRNVFVELASLTHIPDNALAEIASSLDHIVMMRKGTYAATENVHFACLARHETKNADIIIRRPGEAS